MAIINCIMCYNDIIDLIHDGFKPVKDLRLALEHKQLISRKEIPMYLDFDNKLIDIMGYYAIDQFHKILSNPICDKYPNIYYNKYIIRNMSGNNPRHLENERMRMLSLTESIKERRSIRKYKSYEMHRIRKDNQS